MSEKMVEEVIELTPSQEKSIRCILYQRGHSEDDIENRFDELASDFVTELLKKIVKDGPSDK